MSKSSRLCYSGAYLFQTTMVEIFFDIETKKLFDQIENRDNLPDLGVSIVSLYRRKLEQNLSENEGEMRSFWEADFSQMWPLFEGADRIIGFNSLKFDVPVLAPHYHRDFTKLAHFDILEKIKNVLGHRISLDALAKQTLGKTKLADGLAAVDWWNRGDKASLANLKRYCEMDVLVTRDIYDFALKNKRLLFMDRWNQPKEVELNFDYLPQTPVAQMGLF